MISRASLVGGEPFKMSRVLDQRRRARKIRPPIPIMLADDPRVRDLVVPPRSLGVYDALARSGDKEDDDE